MSSPQLDPRTFQNLLSRLDRLTDYLRPKIFTTHYDNLLLTIAAAIGDTPVESKIYDFETALKEIQVHPDRYDAGDYYFFAVGGHEFPPKDSPFYSWGSGTTGEKRKHVFDGDLPVCPPKKPIQIVWHNAAAQAKKVSVTFKRFVSKG